MRAIAPMRRRAGPRSVLGAAAAVAEPAGGAVEGVAGVQRQGHRAVLLRGAVHGAHQLDVVARHLDRHQRRVAAGDAVDEQPALVRPRWRGRGPRPPPRATPAAAAGRCRRRCRTGPPRWSRSWPPLPSTGRGPGTGWPAAKSRPRPPSSEASWPRISKRPSGVSGCLWLSSDACSMPAAPLANWSRAWVRLSVSTCRSSGAAEANTSTTGAPDHPQERVDDVAPMVEGGAAALAVPGAVPAAVVALARGTS